MRSMIACVVCAHFGGQAAGGASPMPVQFSPSMLPIQRKNPPFGGDFAWAILHDAGWSDLQRQGRGVRAMPFALRAVCRALVPALEQSTLQEEHDRISP